MRNDFINRIPENFRGLYARACQSIDNEIFKEAVQMLNLLLKHVPDEPSILYNLAFSYYSLHNFKEAIKIAKENLNDLDFRIYFGEIIFHSYLNMGKTEQAAMLYKMHFEHIRAATLTSEEKYIQKKMKKYSTQYFGHIIKSSNRKPMNARESVSIILQQIKEEKEAARKRLQASKESSNRSPIVYEKKQSQREPSGKQIKPLYDTRMKKDENIIIPQTPIPLEPIDKLKQAQALIKEVPPIEIPHIEFKYTFNSGNALKFLKKGKFEKTAIYDTRLEGEKILLLKGFDDLICLNTLRGVEKFWYQVETVKKVLKYFRGRSLLCDEVGLGKTIEAGMILKEYFLRGLAKRILILTPPSLVSQWKTEMEEKFDLSFATTLDADYQQDSDKFWKSAPRIIASIATARSKRNFEMVTDKEFDLIIVDEAHHFKNKQTLAWKLVDSLKKKFILLLTATPVQNDLMELYNLITLLSPGTLRTPTQFKQEFVKRGDVRKPLNADKLRDLLSSVMIRNTRAMVDIKLPPRYASTYRFEQDKNEKLIYEKVLETAKDIERSQKSSKMLIMTLLSEAGSSPWAVSGTIEKLLTGKSYPALENKFGEIVDLCHKTGSTGKVDMLMDILKKSPEKKIIFTKYRGTLDYLAMKMKSEKIPAALFHGGMTPAEKEKQMEYFENSANVLLSTEVGGEGRNMQFCNTMINFDLPWNPMQIEQRIGRIHRIGQEKDVYIFNLSQKGTIEDYILSVLDSKINMFELVIGEIGMILGNLDAEREFPDIIMDLWSRSGSGEELQTNFDKLGDDLVKAKEEYLKIQELDNTLFSEDYEV